MATEDLRSEIRGYQAAQADLRKWKFVVIGAVSAVGLGLAEKTVAGGSRLALFVLPLLALYPDLLIRDYDLRTAVITAFMRRHTGVESEYENFVEEASQTYPWILGHFAALASTLTACLGVIVMGILYLRGIAAVPEAKPHEGILPSFDAETSGWLLLCSGIIGVILCFLAEGSYYRKVREIDAWESRTLTEDETGSPEVKAMPVAGGGG